MRLFRYFKPRYCALGIVLAVFLFAPNIVMGLFAQQRGHEFMPCLCCLDVRIPEMTWWQALITLAVLVAILVFCAWMSSIEDKRAQQKREEDKKKYGDFAGKLVEFTLDGGQKVKGRV